MPEDYLVGKNLGGRYQIQSLVGRGGMATVYKALDTNLGRIVAIKIIHPHLADQPDFLQRFENEARLVAQFHHPNIPVIFDFNQDGGYFYIAMEYIDGETLENRLKTISQAGQRLPVKLASEYFSGLCEAVDYAHRQGVVHRDIKPANIMIDQDHVVKLMDFGISKIIGGQRHTATGATIGSAHYIAPEQIQGFLVDARTDIYALGVTFFEMCCGRPPFEADSALTLMMMHISDPVPDLHQLNPAVPAETATIIQKAMAKKPEDRYRSATELAALLRQSISKPALQLNLQSTMIDQVIDRQQLSTPHGASSSQVQIPEIKPAKNFPSSPEETAYPVHPRGTKTWQFLLLGALLLGVLGLSWYFMGGRSPAPEASSAQVSLEPPTENVSIPVEPGSTITPAEEIAPVATDTLSPTATPTLEPSPTFTPQPDNSGFNNQCIQPGTWLPYKSQGVSEENGCWNLSHWMMSASPRGLRISVDQMPYDSERSIHRKLAQSVKIRFKLKVNLLRSLTNLQGGLAVGIGRPEGWQRAGIFLVFRSNAVNPTMQVYLTEGVNREGAFYQDAELVGEHEIEIQYDHGSVRFYLNGVEIQSSLLLSASDAADPVFSIGYSLPQNGALQAEIFDLRFLEEGE